MKKNKTAMNTQEIHKRRLAFKEISEFFRGPIPQSEDNKELVQTETSTA